ncbi:hypothetical protein [Winogradskyella sp. R77965]|uniref:hypothetical protein n=1 Tax=Winogradskyella sp. R77965 TaxID=3093872 RepID=UPI0037DCEFA3
MEHVSDATFLTFFKGKEVFAQIQTIIGQMPIVENDSMMITYIEQNHWTMITRTNGYFTGLMTNYFQDTLVVGNSERYVTTTWYINYPNNNVDIVAHSLFWEDSQYSRPVTQIKSKI